MKKKLVVFCDKYLGFTLLSAGGVLDDLVADYDVTLLTTGRSETIVELMQGKCTILTYNFKDTCKWNRLNKLITNSLVMTYAKTPGGRRNRTGSLHRKAHWKKAKKENLSLPFFGTAICLSYLAQEFKTARYLLTWLFQKTINTKSLSKILTDINPILVLATTAGLDKDGILFAAAKSAGIKSLALIQSWDRTASKGYPTSKPDFCIVWNEAMAKEAEFFLEIPKSNIFVEGAPPWDQYLSLYLPLPESDKADFYKEWKLDPSKKLVFFAINGLATHDENIRLIEKISSALKSNLLPGIQFLFRSHPAYLTHHLKRYELEAAFDKFGDKDARLMHPIVSDPNNKDYIVTPEDRHFMHQAFRACDVTVSIMSTWMIESSIFDKPNICIEYGRYQTNLYDFDLSEYNAEHIARIFNYGAVHRVLSFEQLIKTINETVVYPDKLSIQRASLNAHETGPNKGYARQAFYKRISKLSTM